MSARYFNEVNPDGPLAGTRCPVSPGRLRELYEGGWREEDGKRVWCEPMSTTEIAYAFAVGASSIRGWLVKSGINTRNGHCAGKITAKKYDYAGKLRDRLLTGQCKISAEKRRQITEKSVVLATRASKKSAEVKRVKLICQNPCCHKEFKVPPYKATVAKFCSTPCAQKTLSFVRRGRTCHSDIWCPRCLKPALRNNIRLSGTTQFFCVCCGRQPKNPLLEEPTPRQVLERHRELRAQGIALREVPSLELSAL